MCHDPQWLETTLSPQTELGQESPVGAVLSNRRNRFYMNDDEATPVELAVSACIDAMDMDDLISYANQMMAEYYTTHASAQEIEQLLTEFGPSDS